MSDGLRGELCPTVRSELDMCMNFRRGGERGESKTAISKNGINKTTVLFCYNYKPTCSLLRNCPRHKFHIHLSLCQSVQLVSTTEPHFCFHCKCIAFLFFLYKSDLSEHLSEQEPFHHLPLCYEKSTTYAQRAKGHTHTDTHTNTPVQRRAWACRRAWDISPL